MDVKSLAPPGRVKIHCFDDPSLPAVYRYYTDKNVHLIPQLQDLPPELLFDIRTVASVLPFKVNEYVLDELIDWSDVPDDPMFQLTFPQRGMLAPEHYETMANLLRREASLPEIREQANRIRMELNPHPAGQLTLNVPHHDGEPLEGVQHKYKETVLYFPAAGQTCHSYCTFCFRWAQFAGMPDLRFASKDAEKLRDYVAHHSEVTNILITGGDPLVMKTSVLKRYVEPLIDPALDRLHSIRFGTKAIAYWPQRFVIDEDADELLRLFERIVRSGRQVAIMAHFNHHRELDTPMAREAVRRIQDTGAIIRSQSPVLGHINDNAVVWELMWREQIRLGIVPYYMFMERDTGARNYFHVPLATAHKIYREAYRHVCGLGRTVRGPSMSATPGKVEVVGTATVAGEKVFVLRFIQGRNADWVDRPFFAKFDPDAVWLDDLKPAFGEEKFFFEDEMAEIERRYRHSRQDAN